MRKSLLACILFCFSFTPIFAQSDSPGGATVVVLSNWITGGTNYAGMLGATGSGYASCAGIDNDDVWYRFTATTQAVKITGTTSAFNMVIELWTNGPGTLITCENTNAGNVGETLRASGLTIGQQYYIRLHSTGVAGAGNFNMAVSFLPKANIRSSYTPNPLGDDAIPGYKISNNTSRNVFSAAENLTFQATRYKFEDSSNGDLFYSTSLGSTGLKNLNDFVGLCYDKTYYAWVEIQVEGWWCGYSAMYVVVTEAYPNTTLQAGFAAQTYQLSEWIKCNFVGDEQLIEWELTTDNGSTVIIHNSGNSTYCYFDEVECIRYNKIYNVRIRVNYCGVWGPWGAPNYIFTAPLPYTNVRAEYCNTDQYQGGTILAEFLDVVDQYGWQFAPIETGDPLMVPIGPAIVTYTPTTTCFLLPLGLEMGTTYRAGVKPFVGITDACNDPQEGDFGNFCPLHIIDTANPPAMGEGTSMILSEENEIVQKDGGFVRIFKVDGAQFLVNVDARDTQLVGNVEITVFNSAGQIVCTQRYGGVEPNAFLQVGMQGSLAAGIYVVNVKSDVESLTQKIWIP